MTERNNFHMHPVGEENSYEETAAYEKSVFKNYLITETNRQIEKLKSKIANAKHGKTKKKFKDKIDELNKRLKKELEEEEDESPSMDVLESSGKKFEVDECGDFVYNGLKIPRKLEAFLFDFQKDGLRWMLDLFLQGKGGILADEMGLGKTIQALSAIVVLIKNDMCRDVLVLSPLSVIFQWEAEIARIYNIIGEKSPKIYLKSFPKNWDSDPKIFLMGYEGFKKEVKEYIDFDAEITSNRMKYDIVFLDEGHRIKNREAQISRLCKNIKTKSKFVISGTPIQNNLGELWTVMDLVNPQILGSFIDFKTEFINNIKDSNEQSYKYSVVLRSIIDPFILRRLKGLVSTGLPQKIDKILFTTLTPLQSSMYFEVLARIQTIRLNTKNSLFNAIDALRKICNHPALTYPDMLRNSNIIEHSSKMIAMFDLIEKWIVGGNKALIFSQTIQMQTIIKKAIDIHNQNAPFTINYVILNGNIVKDKRKQLVETFNKSRDLHCFLLTTRTGGLGLNLVGADRIIIFDPDWNPAIDFQAKERIYRYGQKSNIEIYRLISRNTIEQKIYEKQIFKNCLSEKILKNPETLIRKDFSELFSYGIPLDSTVRITNDINYNLQSDELVRIKKDDEDNYKQMMNLNSKKVLTGPELIKFINNRENIFKKE